MHGRVSGDGGDLAQEPDVVGARAALGSAWPAAATDWGGPLKKDLGGDDAEPDQLSAAACVGGAGVALWDRFAAWGVGAAGCGELEAGGKRVAD